MSNRAFSLMRRAQEAIKTGASQVPGRKNLIEEGTAAPSLDAYSVLLAGRNVSVGQAGCNPRQEMLK